MELNLKGKRALITGGSKGIGKAIKEELEREGVIVISWSRGEGIDLMKEIPEVPDVNFIIHNVGGMGTAPYEDWDIVMQKNYGIMMKIMTKETCSKLERVICISSIYGKEKGPNPVFAAAKSAQIAYMKSMAGKYSGVTFNTICPGHIDVGKDMEFKGILGKPEYIASLVTFLCSDKAKWINGACVTIDNGESHSF